MLEIISKLQQGDIFAVKSTGILPWLNRLVFVPTTPHFHYGLLWERRGNDFVILESIAKGIAVGLLSFYKLEDEEFYRVNCDEDLRLAAPEALVGWGRAKYDYLLYVKIVIAVIIAWGGILLKEKRMRKLRAEDLRFCYTWDSRLVCTEAVWAGYNSVGVNIVPYGVPPLPSAYRQAEIESVISKISYKEM